MNKSLHVNLVPDTDIVVDRFHRPLPEDGYHYILSHFHGDHYGRLSDKWTAPIHCSHLTGRFIVEILGVREDLIHSHALHQPFVLGGAEVEFMDAEHCPGAVMIFVRPSSNSSQHLHTGDFRATPLLLQRIRELATPKVHTLFLDTTYALATSSFPDQAETIRNIVSDVSAIEATTLVMIAAYSIGKERVIFPVAEALDAKIYIGSERKQNIYSILELSEDQRSRFTSNPNEAQIHVMPFGTCGQIWPFFQPDFAKCEEYLSQTTFSSAVGLLPTGHANASNWNRKNSIVSKGRVTLRLYAYSEHSSATELADCIKLLRPAKLIPTVCRDQKEQTKIIQKFQHLLDQAGAAKSLFDKPLKRCKTGRDVKQHGQIPTSLCEPRHSGQQDISDDMSTRKNRKQTSLSSGLVGAVQRSGDPADLETSVRREGTERAAFQALSRPAQAQTCISVDSDDDACVLEDCILATSEADAFSSEDAGNRDAALAAVLSELGDLAKVEEARKLLLQCSWDVAAAVRMSKTFLGSSQIDPHAKRQKVSATCGS